MKLLILSFYFRPDLSAGSFRATALVKALREVRPDVEIEVVTTLPNRYVSFTSEAQALETSPGVTIHRVAVPTHRSGMLDQARAFLVFGRQAERITGGRRYDAVFATSSRLMTAALGAHLSRRLRAPLYLDIRDIFVDTIKDILPGLAPLAQPLFGAIEGWTIRRAAHVNLVSGGFAPYFEGRYPRQVFSYFTNGVDDEFMALATVPERRAPTSPLRVLYAGNLGEGQGLHAILPALARKMGDRVRFRVLGDGGRRGALVQGLAAAGVSTVELLPPVARTQLVAEYAAADVLFLHLNDHDAFRKVLPSKLFEYAATGKPIWAGVAGYSAEFGAAEIDNLALFPPCDAAAAAAAFDRLEIGVSDRTAFARKYARAAIMREMAADIVRVASA